MTADGAGNLFIADMGNHRVRKVNPSGTITTVAGNGAGGYSGDGGAATAASLFFPHDVAADDAGNLFIADTGNNRVRKVDPSGTITTVAGNGGAGYSGDGGLATVAEVREPYAVAIGDGATLYIADSNNNVVRKVDSSGAIMTVAGNGSAGYSGDGGPATLAQLYTPYGLAIDNAGNLFIVDRSNFRVRRVDRAGTITTVAGNGSAGYSDDGGAATEASMFTPGRAAIDDAGNVFIPEGHRVRRVDVSGTITTVAGNGSPGYSGDGGLATAASLLVPDGVAVDRGGNLLIADTGNYRVREVEGIASSVQETAKTWVALGDSYSAGVGGTTKGTGQCKQEKEWAYATQARRLLALIVRPAATAPGRGRRFGWRCPPR